MKILVTDGHTRAALALTRALGKLGHAVHVSAPVPTSVAGCSRYCATEHPQATTEEGPGALLRSLVRIVRDVEPSIILGVTDPTLTVVHAAGSDFEPALLPPPGASEYERASDKARLFVTCQELGIRVPEGTVVEGGRSPSIDVLSSLGSPLVVRPAFSWRVDGDRWLRGVVSYEKHEGSLRERVARDRSLAFPYLVQRHVEGTGCGLFLLAHHGRILRVFAHRRLREKPPAGGVSTLCASAAVSEDLLDAAHRWVGSSGWSGLAMLEFKREASTGLAYLLEINARPWGSMALADAAGMDFARALISLDALGTEVSNNGYRVGVHLRWWWGDVDHFYLLEKSRGRAGGRALARGLLRAATSGPLPEAWDTFVWEDPLPFAIETLAWLRTARPEHGPQP